jgi:APA family basic amino acid/polyamine antiporter
VEHSINKVGFYTASSIVIANMIGTGVFTSLGFQVIQIKSTFALLLLWIVGGVVALTGALTYGELASSIPRSGGEYHFLSKLYLPVLGFLAGWISLLVGFSAPVALASMALASYFNALSGIGYQVVIAIFVVIFMSVIHSFNIRFGGRFQKTVTALKILLIFSFVIAGLAISNPQPVHIFPDKIDWIQVFSPAFAVSLIYVSYSFSGWNAAVYVSDEIDNPQRNIPGSLITGTLVVTLLYFLLNLVFIYTSPLIEMEGKVNPGFIAANHIFGTEGGKIMAGLIVLLLISTISAMIWIGPRVTQVIGEDYRMFRLLSKKNNKQVPVFAIWFQSLITIILIVTSTFEQVLVYSGFILNFFTLMTVAGVFILRIKKYHVPGSVRTWGYPVTPVIFILLSLWTLFYIIKERPGESLMGLITILAGLLIYRISIKYQRNFKEEL